MLYGRWGSHGPTWCSMLASLCMPFSQGELSSTLCCRLWKYQLGVVPCIVLVFVAENHLGSAGTLLQPVPRTSGFFWSLPEKGGSDSKTPTDTPGTPEWGAAPVSQYRICNFVFRKSADGSIFFAEKGTTCSCSCRAVARLSHHNSVCLSSVHPFVHHMSGSVKNGASYDHQIFTIGCLRDSSFRTHKAIS